MTLRLSESDDAALTALAHAEGVSKQEAATRAIREKAARIDSQTEIQRLVHQVVAEDGPLLDHLAQ